MYLGNENNKSFSKDFFLVAYVINRYYVCMFKLLLLGKIN